MLRYGIDSLYLSFQGRLSKDWDERLKQAKSRAQSPDDADKALARVSILDHDFTVGAQGSPLFPFTLADVAYRIQLASSKAKRVPLAYVQISSAFITAVGIDQAVAQLRLLVSAFGDLADAPKISRIDLFCDFTSSCGLDSWPKAAWVSRGREVTQYWDGDACSGWSIGKGGVISGRLYDKTVEIKKSKKEYLKPLWHQAGWEPLHAVYRLEFQFRVEALTELGLTDYATTMSRLDALWRYSTDDWLRLTIPNGDDDTKSRWQTHPLWKALSAMNWMGLESPPLTRLTVPGKAPSDERLSIQYLATLTSYMGKAGITDPLQAAVELFEKTRDHYDATQFLTGSSFEVFARDRAARKATQWHLAFPGIKEALEAEELNAGVLAYRKASGR